MAVKAVFAGDAGVGKTCLINRIAVGEYSESPQTIGCAQVSVTLSLEDGQTVELDVWDTAGQERFRALSPLYFSGAQVAFICFDLTRGDSFDCLRVFVEMIRDKATSDVVVVIVGTKADMDTERSVTRENAENYQKEIGANLYYEVSSKTGMGVEELMAQVGAIVRPPKAVDTGISLNSGKKQKKCKC